MDTIYDDDGGPVGIRFIFDEPVSVRAWHTLHVNWEMSALDPPSYWGGRAFTTLNLWKWLAWHLPYRLAWRWR